LSNFSEKVAFIWEEVWQRDRLLDILARFMHLEVIEKEVDGKKVKKETMIFPRYHQLDSVRKLEAAAKIEKAGHNYLIMHNRGEVHPRRAEVLHDLQDVLQADQVRSGRP
jgi:type I restriction enzyme R subunit